MEVPLSHRPAATLQAAVTLRPVTFMQSARRTEAGWEHQRATTLRQCGGSSSSSGGASSHVCRCGVSACSTAASVGYEERLVPHRGGGSGGGVGGGEGLRFTQAGARLPIGGGRCTVRRHGCTLHSADKCLAGWGGSTGSTHSRNVAATCVWKSENMVPTPVV